MVSFPKAQNWEIRSASIQQSDRTVSGHGAAESGEPGHGMSWARHRGPTMLPCILPSRQIAYDRGELEAAEEELVKAEPRAKPEIRWIAVD